MFARLANREYFFVRCIAQEIQGANCFNKSESIFRLKIDDIGFSLGGIRFGPCWLAKDWQTF